ncbi:trigger factor [Porphyromonadaceae bacterium OttesenSCG-928-L07]|nr:trigger factor [Porphyromonadaceae bacterium OttesenSCG-928-L07]MDL2251257.1 trigger factor [Odoribacter sp. OttesenSCG-928-J03]
MNITKIQNDELNASLKIQLGKDDYASRVESMLKDYQKKAVVDGFRKGKTPMGIVKKMYGKAILVDEINKVLNDALTGYIRENNLNILGEPLPNETEQKELNLDNEEFEFVYDIALSPEVNAKLTKRDKIVFYTIKVDDKMIDQQVEAMRKNNGEMVDTEEVEGTEYLKGEMVELDTDGKEKADGVKNSDASFSLMYTKDEEAVKAFKGAKKGATIKFDAVKAFPNKTDFASMLGVSKEEVESVNNEFAFTIKEIKRFVEAELNQDFFDKVYGKDSVKDEAAFRERVKEDIQNQLKGHSEYRFTIDAREKLIKKNEDVKLPEAFLKRWILATNDELKAEDVEKDFEGYRNEFKWQLIKNAVATEFDIKIEEEDLKKIARQVAASQLQQYGLFGLTDEQLDGFAARLVQDEKQRRQLFEQAYDTKIFGLIKENVKLDEEEISMEDFEKLFQ